MICGDCSNKMCCIYPHLVECFGKVRADSFKCVMDNETCPSQDPGLGTCPACGGQMIMVSTITSAGGSGLRPVCARPQATGCPS